MSAPIAWTRPGVALLLLLALLAAPAAPAAPPAPVEAPGAGASAGSAEEEAPAAEEPPEEEEGAGEEDDAGEGDEFWDDLDEELDDEPVDGPATLSRLLAGIDALEGQPWPSSAAIRRGLDDLPSHVEVLVLDAIVERRIVHSQQLATLFSLELAAETLELALSDGCVLCHIDPESQFERTLFLPDPEAAGRAPHLDLGRYFSDVHVRRGLGCSGCHGGTPEAREHTPDMRERWPRGSEARQEDRSWVPEFCGGCHADTQTMRGFNPALPTDQLAKYKESMHGAKLLRDKDSKAAECVSCHGVHGILGAESRLSLTHAQRLPQTCGRCHSDADYMAGYQADDGRPLPTHQVERFTASVHGKALLERGDLGAPSCNDCHGNHAARPPEVESVSQVCRTCHLAQGKLFDGSRHKRAFDEAGWPECARCHGNHDIQRTSIAMIGTDPGGLCHDCHAEHARDALECARGALHFRETLESFVRRAESIEERANSLAHRGLDPDPLTAAAGDLREAIVQTRTAVHAFEVSTFDKAAEPARLAIATADALDREAEAEYRFRQTGVAVSIGIMVLIALALALKLRGIEARQRAEAARDAARGDA